VQVDGVWVDKAYLVQKAAEQTGHSLLHYSWHFCEPCCFIMSFVQVDGVWVDKAYLVQRAAEQTGHSLLWHKLVCRVPPGVTTFGKPSYHHMLCFSKVSIHFLNMPVLLVKKQLAADCPCGCEPHNVCKAILPPHAVLL
jgi:hypothetical protein